MSKARAYCITLNNWTPEEYESIIEFVKTTRFAVVGKEVGENGTPHLQGYVYFANPVSFTSVKKKIPRAHIEQSKGSPSDNQAYCAKEGKAFVHGECPKQGGRSDIERVVEELEAGANMRGIVKGARSMQSVKIAEVYLKYHEHPREWKPEVRWYYGSTGSGKTRAAREWLGDEDTYTCLDSIKFWEGYDAHENVLIDDFRKDFCKFHQLLKLLDRYEYRVEVKGSSRQLVAKKICITSPYHPSVTYCTHEDIAQLIRRIDVIQCFGDEVPIGDLDGIDNF